MMFENKTLLITGGTGSFGHAVVKRVLDASIKEIRIFSRDEKKQDDMRRRLQNKKVKFYIGDVRDKNSVDYAMHGVDCIFHAAALKQVPSCEFFPMEAVKTNVLGTQNVLDSAVEFGVGKIVVLSTDKASYPINAMGISKAMMEKVATAKSRTLSGTDTTVCCTRYGNVTGSRGSVIPLFIDQIRKGKELTVTNPEMTRFMMTMDEAVDLVLHAFEYGQNGDLFIRKAPAATIETLAKALTELYRSASGIRIIGARHGEKSHETLVTSEEMAKAIEMDRYFRIPCDDRDLNYEKYFAEGRKTNTVFAGYHSYNTTGLDIEGMKELLLKLDIVKKTLPA